MEKMSTNNDVPSCPSDLVRKIYGSMSRHTTEKWDRTDRDDISIQTAVEILKIHITLYLTRIKVNFQSMDIPKYLIDTGLSLLDIYIHILEISYSVILIRIDDLEKRFFVRRKFDFQNINLYSSYRDESCIWRLSLIHI